MKHNKTIYKNFDDWYDHLREYEEDLLYPQFQIKLNDVSFDFWSSYVSGETPARCALRVISETGGLDELH